MLMVINSSHLSVSFLTQCGWLRLQAQRQKQKPKANLWAIQTSPRTITVCEDRSGLSPKVSIKNEIALFSFFHETPVIVVVNKAVLGAQGLHAVVIKSFPRRPVKEKHFVLSKQSLQISTSTFKVVGAQVASRVKEMQIRRPKTDRYNSPLKALKTRIKNDLADNYESIQPRSCFFYCIFTRLILSEEQKIWVFITLWSRSLPLCHQTSVLQKFNFLRGGVITHTSAELLDLQFKKQ